ncbi:uncharacterized protein LOC129285145 isoform X2 [Prosopis cineraria]|uniref:uncharacterized protein LOC129285145 isoform X2 n=1 Tax=Prosopis cineraria TaxID=364024 RepID=UPI00240FBCFA|nr:uncharacterized protein LOC129285145 isoform X2 [Prosopis cineraria]
MENVQAMKGDYEPKTTTTVAAPIEYKPTQVEEAPPSKHKRSTTSKMWNHFEKFINKKGGIQHTLCYRMPLSSLRSLTEWRMRIKITRTTSKRKLNYLPTQAMLIGWKRRMKMNLVIIMVIKIKLCRRSVEGYL